jgi:hypothetical protein
MIYLKSQPQPFTPSWYAAKGGGPVYMMRPGDVVEREMFEAELSGQYNAGAVARYELTAAFQEGTAHLLADSPEQLEEVQQLDALAREIETHNASVYVESMGLPPDEQAAFIVKQQRQLSATERQALEAIEAVLREHWPDFRALIARQERRNAAAPLLAFRQFCKGWEGLETPFAAGLDGLVTADALLGVPQNDMKAAGWHAYKMLYATREERALKNSSAPSNAAAAPVTSSSGAASEKAGTSRASAGRKTPGSRPRRGRSRS